MVRPRGRDEQALRVVGRALGAMAGVTAVYLHIAHGRRLGGMGYASLPTSSGTSRRWPRGPNDRGRHLNRPDAQGRLLLP